MDDQRLMDLDRAGQPVALGELFHRHHRELFGFLCRMTGDRELAADLVQEVFLRAWKHRKSYRSVGSVRGWLYQIARNLRSDAQRRADRDLLLERGLDWDETDPRPEPIRGLVASERLGVLSRALVRLPESQREILVLARVQGLSYGELSELYGCSVGALRVRLSRALRRLRELIEKEEGGRGVA